jgi:hypothetical protein
MTLHRFSVGERWPLPLRGDGMLASIEPGEEGPSLMLVCAMPQPTSAEVTAMRKRPLRIALLPSPPLLWFALATERLSLDAPYAVGLHRPHEVAAILESARRVAGWPEATRSLVTVPLVDTAAGNTIRALRVVSLSRAWWLVLADALPATATITREEHARAIDRDLARWPRTDDMLAAAAISEIGGRV